MAIRWKMELVRYSYRKARMIRFITHRVVANKSTLGLVLMPADLAGLMNGDPLVIELSELSLEAKKLEVISLYFFRDAAEFKDALKEAGVDLRMIGTETAADGSKQTFVAPPRNKIREN